MHLLEYPACPYASGWFSWRLPVLLQGGLKQSFPVSLNYHQPGALHFLGGVIVSVLILFIIRRFCAYMNTSLLLSLRVHNPIRMMLSSWFFLLVCSMHWHSTHGAELCDTRRQNRLLYYDKTYVELVRPQPAHGRPSKRLGFELVKQPVLGGDPLCSLPSSSKFRNFGPELSDCPNRMSSCYAHCECLPSLPAYAFWILSNQLPSSTVASTNNCEV